MTFNYQDRIHRDPQIAEGEAVIKGTRVPLRTVLASLANGAMTAEILAGFPTLNEGDVRAAILQRVAALAHTCVYLEEERPCLNMLARPT